MTNQQPRITNHESLTTTSRDVVVRFDGVSKRYELGAARSVRALASQLVRRPLSLFCNDGTHHAARDTRQELWALKDVSFEVRRGETLGIIGPNGAGKTTILKLLAGITYPTSGQLSIAGRLACLIELGAGFHPELTGRENIFLNASILGLSPKEIQQKLPFIIGFAELADFMDVPVKQYSSGMYARLAFSVAAHIDPQVLLVDEVLAVGDLRFQHRAMRKIAQMQKDGVSIVFVSHDLEAVKKLCHRAIYLDAGKIRAQGDPEEVVNLYHAVATMREGAGVELDAGCSMLDEEGRGVEFKEDANFAKQARFFRHGTYAARVENVEILDESGREKREFRTGERALIRVHVRFYEKVEGCAVGITLRDAQGINLFGINTLDHKIPIQHKKPGDVCVVDFLVKLPFREGSYSVSPAIADAENILRHLDWIDSADVLWVSEPKGEAALPVYGLVFLEHEVTVHE